MKNIDLITTVMANRIMILRLGNALGMSEELLMKCQDECTEQAEKEVNAMIEQMKKEENKMVEEFVNENNN